MKRFVSLLLSISLALFSWVPATNASQYSVLSGTITPPPGFTFERFSVWSGTEAAASEFDAATGNYSITGLATENNGIKSISFTLLAQNPSSSGLAKFTGYISLQSSTAVTNATVPTPQIMNLTIADAQGQPQSGSKLGIASEFAIVGSLSDSVGNSWKTYFWLEEQTTSNGNFSVWAYPGQIEGEISARLVSPYARVNLTTFSFPQNNGAKICLPINFGPSMSIDSSCINAYTPEPTPVPADTDGPAVHWVRMSDTGGSTPLAFGLDVSDDTGVWMVHLLCRDPIGNYSVDLNWDLMSDEIGMWEWVQGIQLGWEGVLSQDRTRVDVVIRIPRNSQWMAGTHTCDLGLRDWVQTDSNWTTLRGEIGFYVPVSDQVEYLGGGAKTGDKIYAGSTSPFSVKLAGPASVVSAGVRLRSLSSGQYRDIGSLHWIGDEGGTFKNQLSFPSDLDAGQYEMQIWWTPEYSPGVKEVYSVNVEVLSQPAATGVEQYRGHGPDDGEFSAWTKVLANGTQMKFYAKYLQPGQKVQFMFQNSSGVYEEFAWKRVTEGDLADDGAYTNLQNHVYFIRTIDLKPGKNRVRILVDGEIVWGTKTYTLK